MIRQPTVLVLGAGASKPYGYPTGPELVAEICDTYLNSGSPRMLEAGYTHEQVGAFRRELYLSGTMSIDSFLATRPQFSDIGKMAIALAIVGREEMQTDRSKLFRRGPQGDWLLSLRAALQSPVKDFPKNRLSIVTFNYDRVLEQFLFLSLWATYGGLPSTINKLLQGIPIIHVHGVLGHIEEYPPAFQRTPVGAVRPYGTNDRTDLIASSARMISVVDDEKDAQDSAFSQAQGVLMSAERIAFLGLGYDEDNLRRLGIDRLDPNRIKITGTRYGVTPLQVESTVKLFDALRELKNVGETETIKDFLQKSFIL